MALMVSASGVAAVATASGSAERAKQFEALLRLTPEGPCALESWASPPPKTFAACDAALARDPGSQFLHTYRGLAELRAELNEAALADFNFALALNPANARSYYGRGIARIRLGDQAGGLADVNTALAISPYLPMFFTGNGLPPPAGAKPGKKPKIAPAEIVSRPRGSTYTRASWADSPPKMGYYPPFALAYGGNSGKVTLNCEATLEGSARDCIVVAETAQDYAMPDAALRQARSFRLKPAAIDGVPVAGGRITVTLDFKPFP